LSTVFELVSGKFPLWICTHVLEGENESVTDLLIGTWIPYQLKIISITWRNPCVSGWKGCFFVYFDWL